MPRLTCAAQDPGMIALAGYDVFHANSGPAKVMVHAFVCRSEAGSGNVVPGSHV